MEYLTKEELSALYYKLGEIYFYQNEFDLSKNHFKNSLSLCEASEDLHGVAKAKNSLGVLMIEQGLYKEGKALFDAARNIASEQGFANLVIKCDISLGNYFYMQGDTKSALEKYFTVKEYAETKKIPDLLAKALLNIASSYRYNSDFENSMNFVDKASKILEKSSNKFSKALFYLVKGETLIFQNELQTGLAILTCAFTLFSEIGDRLSIADTYRAMGILYSKKGDENIALSYLETSVKLNRSVNNYLNLGETYLALAEHFKQKSDYTKALIYYKNAKECFIIIPGSKKVEQIDTLITTI